MDLAYYSYLAQTVAPRELARAVAARARKAMRSGTRAVLEPLARPFLYTVPRELRRRGFHPLGGPRPALVDAARRDETAALVRERWPEAAAFVLREAEACLRGELPVFGKWKDCRRKTAKAGDFAEIDYARDPIAPAVVYDVRQPGPLVNLFQPGADAKAAWEVGRLQHLWRFGQARWLAKDAAERSAWARAWLGTVRQFRRDCPAGFGVQWSVAMEVSARAMHAALTFAFVWDDPAIDNRAWTELLDFLDEHCRYIETHLEDTGAIRTNHYAADLVGLVVVGALFPELPRAGVWLRDFGKLLWAEIARQTRRDGTHFESSLGYQRLIGELFLAAVLAAREGGAPASREVERAVGSLFRSLGDTLSAGGLLPQIGDLDSCRGLPLMPRAALDCGYVPALGAAALSDPLLKRQGAECPVEVAWLLGPDGVRRFDTLAAGARAPATLLQDGGIAVLRDADRWLCLSAGPNGQGGTGGHAHNDKNSIELAFGDVHLVCDRGTFVYARDPQERNARRSTAAHSTVQVDAAEQNRLVPGRLFALPDTARARVLAGPPGAADGVQTVVGEHQGYARLGIARHRRTAALHRGARAAAVVDELEGTGQHLLHLRYYVPQSSVVLRAATAAEAARLEKLHSAKLSFGYDPLRCAAVLDAAGREVALFAFGATLPWRLSSAATDVSPGYAERREARLLWLELRGEAPAKLFTAVLDLRP